LLSNLPCHNAEKVLTQRAFTESDEQMDMIIADGLLFDFDEEPLSVAFDHGIADVKP